MNELRIGLDVGSTTLKCIVLDARGRIIHEAYERHYAQIQEKSAAMLSEIADKFPNCAEPFLCISGSAGMGIAEALNMPFEQEVYATRSAVKRVIPDADCVIELGGEDAKILFVSGMTEVRMNGSCAGGTGAFIDQMASLLGVTPIELDELAEKSERVYDIASRCGVFAKSDIQPLLNQGAKREDIAESIFAAVVHQTISGLSQGRRISGKVVYLGGPLTYFPMLRKRFDTELGAKGICPEHSLYFVAVGAALSPTAKQLDIKKTIARIREGYGQSDYKHCPPLFEDAAAYEAFSERHAKTGALVAAGDDRACKRVYIGVDAGSTTVKAVAMDEGGRIVDSIYTPSTGNPVPVVRDFLIAFYQNHPGVEVVCSAATGYGEELIRNAFNMDAGLVETMAHFLAAQAFQEDVDFIIDIGGQDIKCFKIRGGAIDNIFLNEACSSGCGSFLQTFAGAMNLPVEEFAKLGLFADRPVDLGSRCTVFMNSSVKQAQRDGASVENISAGLSISVVKNALYKVIRAADASALGERIVVQGGTFLNDAVLRAFEMEIGREVIRPKIAGLMGAYGAALYAKASSDGKKSGMLDADKLENFEHHVKAATCGLCENHCKLTINDFGSGHKYISGNRCERALGVKQAAEPMNLLAYKRELLNGYTPLEGGKARIGIPMGLNMWELLPFWHTFFTRLGYRVEVSPASDRALYQKGQHTIPSDTVCYPAKLMHGHVEALTELGVDYIFYPCMSYNLDEGLGDNHYNCPVVAYYPEVIQANTPGFGEAQFIGDYVGLHREKDFPGKMRKILLLHGMRESLKAVKEAAEAAYREQAAFREKVLQKGTEYLDAAKKSTLPVIILAGRPYHLDAEINHGIDQMIAGFGAVIVTEDAISPYMIKQPTSVLNQWTYHARLYASARYVAASGDAGLNLVQLVSFGCGVDAITTDEVRAILESAGRIYTQIKIDEISNLGAAKIRLRSLFTALELKEGNQNDVQGAQSHG